MTPQNPCPSRTIPMGGELRLSTKDISARPCSGKSTRCNPVS